jgi:hypothetical protein
MWIFIILCKSLEYLQKIGPKHLSLFKILLELIKKLTILPIMDWMDALLEVENQITIIKHANRQEDNRTRMWLKQKKTILSYLELLKNIIRTQINHEEFYLKIAMIEENRKLMEMAKDVIPFQQE